MKERLSKTWLSCDFTARASGQYLPPDAYSVPPPEVRLLRARLLLEETVETINALGFVIAQLDDGEIGVHPAEAADPDLEKIIDGCCDVDYVAIGTLQACGVPDVPHADEVVRANNDKFPGGVGVKHPTVPGKYGKPPGWRGPDHRRYFPQEEG